MALPSLSPNPRERESFRQVAYRVIYTTTTEKVEIEQRCFAPSQDPAQNDYNAVSNLTTTTRYYWGEAAGGAARERVKSVEYPDGRKDSYSYVFGYFSRNAGNPGASAFDTNALGSNTLQTTVLHATAADPGGVTGKSTREITIGTNFYGSVLMQESWALDTDSAWKRIG